MPLYRVMQRCTRKEVYEVKASDSDEAAETFNIDGRMIDSVESMGEITDIEEVTSHDK